MTKKISQMKDGKNVPKDWKIREFKPLLDEHGLFCEREEGRIRHKLQGAAPIAVTH